MTTVPRRLRQTSTDAERLLWRHLRNRQLGGHKFRRQHKIGSFVADFACLERRLIVEVDGGQHANPESKDPERTAWLESEGYSVLRFWNNEVLTNIEGVLARIQETLDAN